MRPDIHRLRAFGLIALLSCLAAAQAKGPAVGSPAPDFTAYSFLDGSKTRLSDQHGKIVILTFWATWCAPCRQELPNLESIQEHVGNDRLVVLAVSYRDTDETQRYLRRKAKEAGWNIAMLADPNSSIAARYGVSAIPHMVVIDRTGTIVAVHEGFGEGAVDELLPQLNALLSNKPLAPIPAAGPQMQ
ncbi:MAG: TlpA family protein disulfide reductase [Proteobacteria bacterium]|nr:TlpA family protein disulfide reductase [Pseudomonadota bacterium]